MPTVRHRLAVALIRAGTDQALDRRTLERGLARVPPGARGRADAMRAVRLAACVDSALLWAGWRLMPRSLTRTG